MAGTKAKPKTTLGARMDALEARVAALEGSVLPAAFAPAKPVEARQAAAPVVPGATIQEEVLEANDIRNLLDVPHVEEPAASSPAGGPRPKEAPPGDDSDGPEPEPGAELDSDWLAGLDDSLLIEALAVPDKIQGKDVVFVAEPVDEAAVARLRAEFPTNVPVIGRPIEDVLPKLRERLGLPV